MPDMNAANPDKLKLVKDITRTRRSRSPSPACRTPTRVYLGGSDFKVYEADLAAAKFEPKELYAHESYVTGVALAGKTLVSGGYDGKLTWWDTEATKVDPHRRRPREVDPQGGRQSPDGKLVASVADDMVCQLWDAETGKLRPRAARPRRRRRRTTSRRCSTPSRSRRRQATWRPATRSATSSSGTWRPARSWPTVEAPVMYTWDPVQRLHSIGGIRSLAFSPDGKHAGRRRHRARSATSTTWRRRPASRCSTGRPSKRLAEFASDKCKGLVNRLAVRPGRLLAARRRRGRRRLPALLRRGRQEDAAAGEGRRCTSTTWPLDENARDGRPRRAQQDCGV